MKNFKVKNENAITLIALIITIIILVILAAVSIRAVSNMGIVGRTVNGSQDYARQAKAENQMLKETTNTIDSTLARINEIQGDYKLYNKTIQKFSSKTEIIV